MKKKKVKRIVTIVEIVIVLFVVFAFSDDKQLQKEIVEQVTDIVTDMATYEMSKEEIDNFLKENSYELRNESGTLSDYYKTTNGDYIVHCQIKEGNTPLIDLNLSAPDDVLAEHMCMNWKNYSEDIYTYIISRLK